MNREGATEARPGSGGAAAPAAPAGLDETCRNCGAVLYGMYCSRCGQSVRDRSRSVWTVIHELLQDFLHFDSRVLRTLVCLLFRPGRMTREYMLGRRGRFVPPLRLYLFSSLVFFLVLSLANIALVAVELVPDGSPEQPAAADGSTAAPPAFRVQAGGRGWELPPGVSGRLRLFVDLDSWKPAIILGAATAAPAPAGDAAPADLSANLEGSLGDRRASGSLTIETGNGDWESRLVRGIALSLDHPQSLNSVMGDNLAKLMFVLMPLFAVLLAVLYRRQRLYFVDHLAFAFHLHAFVFITLTGIALARGVAGLDLLGDASHGLGYLGLLGVHGWVALKTAYGQGWVKTSLKWCLLGSGYGLVLVMGFVGLLLISLPEV